NLKLKDRKYVCDCGYAEDRDLNAAFNLRDATEYKIAN
ncbi:MAG TPA: transposase, partial [Fusobacteriaceae bacterium]|nr:transposase [Fusobacteriaceae bacterium]